MESVISWYQRRIGNYDLQLWEKAVEIQEIRSRRFSKSDKRSSMPKPELIDLDLVKGTTFSKNKPQHSVWSVVWIAFRRIMLLPFCYHWWMLQTSRRMSFFLIMLYTNQCFVFVAYYITNAEQTMNIPRSEIIFPFVLMYVVGLTHCQVASTNFRSSTISSEDSINKKRTLSSVLLEPAQSCNYKKMLFFVKKTAKNKAQDDNDKSVEYASDFHVSDDSCESGLFHPSLKTISISAILPGHQFSFSDGSQINVRIWENGKWQKCNTTLLGIGSMILKKVNATLANFSQINEYCWLAFLFVFTISSFPLLYRLLNNQENYSFFLTETFELSVPDEKHVLCLLILMSTVFLRISFSTMLFIMLCAAQQTYQRRYLYAKYFSYLTSSRRAKKNNIPHFRLNKIHNIKIWLSLRSYLKRIGPQRSVDVIVSSGFFCSVSLLCFTTFQLMNSQDIFVSSLLYWDCLACFLAFAIFLLHFITVGAKINKKYTSTSIILTEQINLYFQMDKKPHKKEKLHRVNGILSNTAKLIKEIETPYNIYGLTMNPLLYNITRVVVLSAFSGVVSEMLGFKLKVWKIKA